VKTPAIHQAFSLVASVDGLSGFHLSLALSYNSPIVQKSNGLFGPTTGGTSVVIQTSHIGAVGMSSGVRFGLTSAEFSRWNAESSVTAKL